MKLIGISGNWLDDVSEHRLTNPYVKCISENGGIPVILPVVHDEKIIASCLEHIDALLLTGGGDIDPKYWGEELTDMCNKPSEARDWFDMTLARMAYQKGIRTLGICRGMQALAIITGGTLFQDIYKQNSRKLIGHSQKAVRTEVSHSVQLGPDSLLSKTMQCSDVMVNSFHHQAVCSVGADARIVAHADDGIIEAIEFPGKDILAVQWHPEELFTKHSEHRRLFNWLLEN